MKRKYIAWSFVLLLLAGFIYGYYEYTRQRTDSKNLKPTFSVGAVGLLQEFTSNESASNKKYAGQNIIVEVSGTIKDVLKNERGYYTVILGDTNSLSSVRCSMDTVYSSELIGLQRGVPTTLKGTFNGFKADELGIGADIELNFCVLTNKNN